MKAGLTVLLAVASASVNTHVKVETVNFDEDQLNTENNIAETFAWKKEARAKDNCVKFETSANGGGRITVKMGQEIMKDQTFLENAEETTVCSENKITKVVVTNSHSDGWVGKVTLMEKEADKGVLTCTENCSRLKDGVEKKVKCQTDHFKVDGDAMTDAEGRTMRNTTECMCLDGIKEKNECTLEPTTETKTE